MTIYGFVTITEPIFRFVMEKDIKDLNAYFDLFYFFLLSKTDFRSGTRNVIVRHLKV